MDNLLQEIQALPHVTGGYVYIQTLGPMFSNLPGSYEKSSLNQIGYSIQKIFEHEDSDDLNVDNIELKFTDATILIRKINMDSALITICEPGANLPLVNMTTGMLTKELINAVSKARQAVKQHEENAAAQKAKAAAAPEPQPTPPEAVPEEKIDIDDLLSSSPLAGTLQKYQEALTHAIGPIGEMVMRESVEDWADQGDCSVNRLPELIDILCREIDDEALETEFKSSIAS